MWAWADFRMVFLPCCVNICLVTGCDVADRQQLENNQTSLPSYTHRLLQKQEAFIDRATDLIREVDPFQQQPGWRELARSIRSSQATDGDLLKSGDSPARVGSSDPGSVGVALGRQWELTGDERFTHARRLLERSAALERERQNLLLEWKSASLHAGEKESVGAAWHARRYDVELFFETNMSVLNRYGVDDLGFIRGSPVKGGPRAPSL